MLSQNGFTIAEADLKDRFGYAAAFCHIFGASEWVCQLFLLFVSVEQDVLARLEVLTLSQNGFIIAEADLKDRLA